MHSHERGFLIIAQNNDTVDYVACARALTKSIKYHMPQSTVCLLTDELREDPTFDIIKTFPFGDKSGSSQWKLHNDWQCFYASPFRQTIKIEADMLLTGSIDHWWQGLQHRDVTLTIGCRNWQNQKSSVRHYRQIFDANQLPDVYNAITYWRKSPLAKTFFETVKNIFDNWAPVMEQLKFGKDQPVNTDLAYAIAATIHGIENFTVPTLDYPSLIHMKPFINNTGEDWTKQMQWEITDSATRLNTVACMWPLHYHVKSFAQEGNQCYDQLLASTRTS